MNLIDLGWVAGIIEGEGTVYMHQGKHGKPRCKIAVGNCNEDMLRRLHALTGVGFVNGPYTYSSDSDGRGRKEHKPYWMWSVSKRVDVIDLLYRLHPHMTPRWKQRIDDALTSIKA